MYLYYFQLYLPFDKINTSSANIYFLNRPTNNSLIEHRFIGKDTVRLNKLSFDTDSAAELFDRSGQIRRYSRFDKQQENVKDKLEVSGATRERDDNGSVEE